MIDTLCARVPGDVYAHGDRLHVVLASDARRIMSAPFLYQNRPAMRHDVVVADLADLASCGLPGGRYVIRVAMMACWPRRSLALVGLVSDALMLRVLAGAKREMGERGLEADHRREMRVMSDA